MLKKLKMFVYKELEILASVDTKSIGRMGWLEARPLVEQAPLMHWIEERRIHIGINSPLPGITAILDDLPLALSTV